MNLRREVLHSLKWMAGARFGGQLAAWAITLVVIRILRPADYGLMALAEMLIGFAVLFQELGLYEAMVQKRDLTERQVEQSFGLLLLTNSAIYVVVFAIAPLLANFFGDARLTDIVRVLGVQFPLASIGVVQDAMLSRRMDFKRKSLANLAVTFVNGLTTLGLALAGFGVWALVYGSLAGSIARPIALVIAARHWCRPRFSREGMRPMLRFGSFVTAGRVIWYVYSQADVFIIGKLLGKEVLGFYSIAMQLASLPMQKVSSMLDQVAFAAYSSIQDDLIAIRSHFLKVIRILSLVSFPIFWGISSVSPELVNVVLGQRWQPAIVPMQLLSIVMPLRMVAHGSGSPLTAIGKPHLGTINLAIAFLIMVPAFWLGAHYGALVGVSLAWVVAYPILVLVRLQISLPPLGLTTLEYFKPMAGAATGGLLMYGCVIALRHFVARPYLPPVAGLVLLAAVGAVVYLGFMWLVRRDDCLELIDLVRSRRQ